MRYVSNVMKYIYAHELIIGILLFSLSLPLSYIISNSSTKLSFALLFFNWVSISLIVGSIYRKVKHKSFLPIDRKSLIYFLNLSLVSVFFCIILDFVGAVTTRLWYYPTIPNVIYYTLAPIPFAFYTLILYMLYDILKTKLTRKRTKSISVRTKKLYGQIMLGELIIGTLGIILSMIYLVNHIQTFNIIVLDLNKSSSRVVEWWFIFLILLSVFFVFEYLCYRRKKETFTKDILSGNFVPILAIIIANIIAIILIEIPNSPLQVWVFDNWVFNDIRISNIPIFAIIAWPFQFLTFLSIFRFFFKENEEDIW